MTTLERSSSRELIELEDRYGAHNYHPLDVVLGRGEGVWVWDVDGNRYMDCLSAYSAINQGHAHPRILAALVEQAGRLPLVSRAFRNDQLGPYYRELCELTGFERVLPMNSGAEAVETALKAARKWAHDVKGVPDGKAEIIACDGNFAGRTISIVSFSSEPLYRAGFGPLTPGFILVPYGDADALEAAITPNTAAFIVEPIQGEGGVIVPPEGYLRRVRELCTRHNVLLIADEIQTGLGRTGRLFACDHEDVRPDIVTIGKALSGGFYPVSAVLAGAEVMDVFTPGTHGSTFGGSPLACAVAREALQRAGRGGPDRERGRDGRLLHGPPPGGRQPARPRDPGPGPAHRRRAPAGGRRRAPLLRGAPGPGDPRQGDARQHDPLRAPADHHQGRGRLGDGAHRRGAADAVGAPRLTRGGSTGATVRRIAARAIVLQRPRSSGDRARDF